jgi:hypothetical protein
MSFVQDASIAFPQLRQVNLPEGRVYAIESGKHIGTVLPSITRVLGAKPKPGLEAWKKSVGAKEATTVSSRATNRGTGLHLQAECFLGNQEMPKLWPHIAELWQYLRPWLVDHISTVYAQEQDVYSFILGVAGRFDLLADVDGVFSIVDFKQSNKPKKAEYMHDYYLQGSFYACAVYELTGRIVKQMVFPVTSPEGLVVWVQQPTMTLFEELRDRIAYFYQTFETPTSETLDIPATV